VTFAGLALLATRNLPAIWRDEARAAKQWPAWWVRGLPSAVAVGWAMLLAIPLAVLGPKEHGTARHVVLVLLAVALAIVLIAALVWVSAAASGRPRFVVPPAFRRERGDPRTAR
jgi:hypothetical protein